MDFTFSVFTELIKALKSQDFHFITVSEYILNENSSKRVIILRHDVEARYQNALDFARFQHKENIRGTYYFRFLPDHFDTDIIKEIAALGHEIGYHYDDLSHCKGNHQEALKRFEKNLKTLREFGEVKTICMEGAPLSKWDNRDLWRHGGMEAGRLGSGVSEPQASSRKPHYSDYGIIGEPYFDIDFSRVLYLTETGRRWDGDKVSIRDKVGGRRSSVVSQQSAVGGRRSAVGNEPLEPGTWNLELKLHSTYDIINAAAAGRLPDQVMFTFHPQRWTDKPFPWAKELVLQNVKNVIKRLINNQKSTSINYEKTDHADHAFPGDHSDNNLPGRH